MACQVFLKVCQRLGVHLISLHANFEKIKYEELSYNRHLAYMLLTFITFNGRFIEDANSDILSLEFGVLP